MHASATDSLLRMMIVRDNLGTTTVPSITDAFSSVINFYQGKNALGDPQSRSRFTVLWDKQLDLGSNGDSAHYFRFKKKMNHVCLFSGAAGSDEGKGALYLWIASNEATNDPVVTADARILYSDC